MFSTLIASITSIIVGFVEIGPGVCQVDRLVDGTYVVTEVIPCPPPASEDL